MIATTFPFSPTRRQGGSLVSSASSRDLRLGRRLCSRHVQRRFQLCLERAEIRREASPHSLRHSCVMKLYGATGDVLLVKEALGHRSINSTLVYAKGL